MPSRRGKIRKLPKKYEMDSNFPALQKMMVPAAFSAWRNPSVSLGPSITPGVEVQDVEMTCHGNFYNPTTKEETRHKFLLQYSHL
ncbi:unnamed protein product [Pleuronectes platessa]|uniref:Nucleoporin Nup153 N-terminal domain-containing protein n=1 Tax=Pleuronectes platessa TaxID=8262 RepID=A0A9N7YXA5_PLEPL|nr:unnamed protein product [Pleuronectes platessa]